jgi:hypothetical protein
LQPVASEPESERSLPRPLDDLLHAIHTSVGKRELGRGDPDVTAARLLSAIGWVNGNGTELDRYTAGQACWDTKTALRRLGAFASDWRSEAPTADGATFARAALQSWPTH